MPTDLKPCPFCGGIARYLLGDYDENSGYSSLAIHCSICRIKTEYIPYRSNSSGSQKEAARKAARRWNRRIEKCSI